MTSAIDRLLAEAEARVRSTLVVGSFALVADEPDRRDPPDWMLGRIVWFDAHSVVLDDLDAPRGRPLRRLSAPKLVIAVNPIPLALRSQWDRCRAIHARVIAGAAS